MANELANGHMKLIANDLYLKLARIQGFTKDIKFTNNRLIYNGLLAVPSVYVS